MKRQLRPLVRALALVLAFLFLIIFEKSENPFDKAKDDTFKMYAINVGQADATFFQFPKGKNLLIDGGNMGDEIIINEFLESMEISQVDTIIITHPHEDHIGGIEGIIKEVKVGKVYMPDIENNTKTFEDLIDTLLERDISVYMGKRGDIIEEDDILIELLAPETHEYENLNQYSIVTKISYGETSFLVTGDAEKINEKEMLKYCKDKLPSDVLRVAHHGSETSSSLEFIKEVNPSLAIISVGEDNYYGHPHGEVISKLKKLNIPVLRTDKSGTILVESDGKNISYIEEY